MREYDKTTLKIAERVFEKGDEILAQRKKRAAKIRHITYAASGLCAAVIVCFGVWHFSSSSKKPYENNNIIVSTQTAAQTYETTSAATTASAGETDAPTTETSVTPVNTTTAAKNITTAAYTTTAIRRTTTALKTTPARTTVTVKTSTRRTTTPLTTSTITGTVADETHQEIDHPEPTPATTTSFTRITDNPVVTATSANQSDGEEKFTTYPPTTATVADTTTSKEIAAPTPPSTEVTVINDMRELFLTYPATAEVKNDTLCLYNKQNTLISPDRIDTKNIYLTQVRIKISDKESLNLGMEMYNIIGTSRKEAVAVRFLQTDEYYLFTNPDKKT